MKTEYTFEEVAEVMDELECLAMRRALIARVLLAGQADLADLLTKTFL